MSHQPPRSAPWPVRGGLRWLHTHDPRLDVAGGRAASSGEMLNQVWILTQARAYVRRPPGGLPGSPNARSNMPTIPTA